MKSLILALQFLTRLYLPWNIDGGEDLFARSVKWFPVAGLIIGLMEAGFLWCLLQLLSPLAAAVLLVLADIALTGGLHMDGLADTIDGLSSHRSKERMLEIMKDSHIGTFGVIAIVGTILFRTVILVDLFSWETSWMRYGIVVAVPVISRLWMAVLIFISEYARKEGMGGLFFAHKDAMNPLVTVLLGLIAGLVAGWYMPALLTAGLITALVMRAICYHKIGGMTGDTLGASLEIMESVMLVAAVLAARYWIGG